MTARAAGRDVLLVRRKGSIDRGVVHPRACRPDLRTLPIPQQPLAIKVVCTNDISSGFFPTRNQAG